MIGVSGDKHEHGNMTLYAKVLALPSSQFHDKQVVQLELPLN